MQQSNFDSIDIAMAGIQPSSKELPSKECEAVQDH